MQGEEVRGEAAGVVAQITSPALDQHLPIIGLIENMNDLLKTLIGEKSFFFLCLFLI